MWSPRELAELASTSRRTVRHYHDLGLLPAPDRASNGYLQYDVHHLVRLLRIRRLVELGLSLSDIAALDELGHPAEALQALHGELGEDIERLRRARQEVAEMLASGAPSELPLPLAGAAAGLTKADRVLLVALSRLMSPETVRAYADLQSAYTGGDAVQRFDTLPGGADAEERQRTADALVEYWADFSAQHGDQLRFITTELQSGTAHRRRTIGRIVQRLYTPAQLDVLARVRERAGPDPYL